MAKRKHLPVLTAGKKYEGWMPFSDGEPLFMSAADYYPDPDTPFAEIYATRKDALQTAEDVRHVTIIVTRTKR